MGEGRGKGGFIKGRKSAAATKP